MAVESEIGLLLERFKAAKRPEDIFGLFTGDSDTKLKAAKEVYRYLAKSCHEDLFFGEEKPIAKECFVLLGEWWIRAQDKIEHHTYGDYSMGAVSRPVYKPLEMKVKGKNLRLDSILTQGSFSTVYSATYDGTSTEEKAFVKVARLPSDNDLLENEYTTLQQIYAKDSNPNVEAFLVGQRKYAPRPVSSFFISGKNNTKHRATILTVPKYRCFTIETLLREKLPNGIEPNHVYWIYRRLLLTQWMAHLKGFVHGGTTPDHVLVYPGKDTHGIVLLDWTCATKIDGKIPAFNPNYRDFYPAEVFNKEPATPATDIYMAAATMMYALGGDHTKGVMPSVVPAAVVGKLRECLDKNVKRRPQDAELYYNDFGKVIGKKQFAGELVVP
jgi:hypothetical protein